MHATANGQVTSACSTREEAVLRQLECRHCSLAGHLTIFRKDYTGLPTVEVVDSGGEVKNVRAAVACHCSCEVGRWMRSCCSAEVQLVIPELRHVGVGKMKNWTPLDPTLPDWNDDDPVDWKAARDRFAAMGRRVVEKIYPKSDGNRKSAYREMAESIPGSKPELSECPF